MTAPAAPPIKLERIRRYLALGDSISVDDFTGQPGGGAASQLARRLGLGEGQFMMHARDGKTTRALLDELATLRIPPDLCTVTIGGNDLFEGREVDEIRSNLAAIGRHLALFECPVILNTIYDPTDGNDAVMAAMDLPRDVRRRFDRINDEIRALAGAQGFLLCDLEALFFGHGIGAADSWFVYEIEVNHAGATAIAEAWYALLAGAAASTLRGR